MKYKQYQETAINRLVDEMLNQLDIDGMRRKIVFQAPTGSGKTVMMTEAMARLHESIADSDCQYTRVAYVWIAPNALHIQSYRSMKNAFTETKRLTPVIYDELDLSYEGYIRPGEVLFVNWQSINKSKNLMVKGSEKASSIYDIIKRTTWEHDIPIVCIIDEEHMFGGDNAKKSEKVLQQISPKVEVRISATPKTLKPDGLVKIERSQVINEGMIKMGISLNPAIKGAKTDDALNIFLLNEALKKRKELADAYTQLGIKVNPLLLVQLPNDDSAVLSQDEENLKNCIITNLELMHSITSNNGKLAIWLSNEKTNLENIEKNDYPVEVLLFKQAIAMGWDCPRAAVLLIFRKLSSESFTIQTVGRIMRMPQQKFYTNPILNTGYVYTDLSADVIKIEPDALGYINKQHAYRREGLANITLKSYKEERTNKENNVLRSDFKKVLLKYMKETWTLSYMPNLFNWDDDTSKAYSSGVLENRKIASKYINLNISRVQVEIPSDMNIIDEEGVVLVENKTGFARTINELKQVFDKFCSSLLNGWSKVKCIPVLEFAVIDAMEQLFEIFETDAYKVICSKQNKNQFADVISRALNYYKNNVLEKKYASDRGFVQCYWTVPEIRDYNEASWQERNDVENHALLPFFEFNNVSKPELHFTEFLEGNSDSIDWWYKNGDSGADNFAVLYNNSQGKKALFYVDYIIRLKNGKIFLFDTKSENSDSEATYKHSGLLSYISEESNEFLKLAGGITIEENNNWKYSPLKIENTNEITMWNTFNPSQE